MGQPPTWIRYFPASIFFDTFDLSPGLDSTYRRMIDLTYLQGGTLERDVTSIASKIRRRKEWVQHILDGFFELSTDGVHYTNCKCTDEVAHAYRASSARVAGGKASAKARKEKKTDPAFVATDREIDREIEESNPIQSNGSDNETTPPTEHKRGTNLLAQQTAAEFQPVIDRWPKPEGSAKAQRLYVKMVTAGHSGKTIIANCLAHADSLEAQDQEPKFWPRLDRFLEDGDWGNVQGHHATVRNDPELAEFERSAREDHERIKRELAEGGDDGETG